ncbi:MAG TPA: glycosyltransferase family 2 protein, partial [Candidatus Thermoplasmatota archaeon]
LLRFDQNIGFAAGCNRALERARGEVIFLLNNDAELTAGVLARVDEVLQQHPEAGSVMCSMRFLDDPNTINSTGIHAFWDGSAIDRHWKMPLTANPPAVNHVLGPCGGAAAWRREVIDRVGFLNEEYFMYSEDVDMALRAQRAGFACMYVPDAVVLHKGGASAARRPQRELMAISYRNTLLTLQRNLPAGARLRGLAMFVVRSLTGVVKIGVADPVLRARAVAYWLRHRARIAGERRAIRALGDDSRVLRWLHLTQDYDP